MMSNLELEQQRKRIYSLIEECENKFEEDDELKSHMAKYICILCSGFLENAVHYIYSDWVTLKKPHIHIECYVTIMLSKINNPNSQKLKELAKSFNSEWENQLKEFLKIDQRDIAINYIISDRHNIAHGKDSDITLLRIKSYFDKAIEVMLFIEKQLSDTL